MLKDTPLQETGTINRARFYYQRTEMFQVLFLNHLFLFVIRNILISAEIVFDKLYYRS